MQRFFCQVGKVAPKLGDRRMVFVNRSRVLLTGSSLDDSIRDGCGVVCLEGKDNVDGSATC